MPTEHVLHTDHHVDSFADWQVSLDREAFPLRLVGPYYIPLSSAVVRCVFGKTPTSFAIRCWTSDSEQAIDRANDGRRSSRYTIRFSETGDEPSGLAATLAAIAYAAAVGGVFSEDGHVIDDLDRIRVPMRAIVPTMLDLLGDVPQA